MEIAARRERVRSLLLLVHMNAEPQIELLEQKTAALIGPETDLFLVEIKIKPTNNIKVFIDGDNGVTIERLVQLNRRLYREIEMDNTFPDGNFSLEISSPGLDEPLKMLRQYRKNTGRPVEVIKKDGGKVEGKLVTVSADGIEVEEQKGKGKKLEMMMHALSFNDIKTTKIQIKI